MALAPGVASWADGGPRAVTRRPATAPKGALGGTEDHETASPLRSRSIPGHVPLASCRFSTLTSPGATAKWRSQRPVRASCSARWRACAMPCMITRAFSSTWRCRPRRRREPANARHGLSAAGSQADQVSRAAVRRILPRSTRERPGYRVGAERLARGAAAKMANPP